jgi:TPR repeat protein
MSRDTKRAWHPRRLMLTAACAMTLAGGPAAADFTDGLAAYDAGNYETALAEFLPLAEAGDAAAQFNLGVIYANGAGVTQDDAEAVRWFRLAAAQGVAHAQNNLRAMYQNGAGVAQNNVMAYKRYNISGINGDEQARENRDRIAIRMLRDIPRAQELARVCMESGYQDCG